jgi:transcriptional regulator with XRE-family HTH domain
VHRAIRARSHAPPVDVLRFGRAIRALRRRQQLRQVDLAARAGVSQSTLSRIELGRVGRVPFAKLRAVGEAVGGEVELTVRWQGEGLDRLLDEAHAAIVEATVRYLETNGWETQVEASFAIGGERGSIDVLGWHPASRLVLVAEVKSVVPDIQSMLFALDRKARLGSAIARDRGWGASGVARVLFLAEGRTSRRRLATHAAIFAAAFPVQGRSALAWLRAPAMPPISGLAFIAVLAVPKSSPTRGTSLGPNAVGRKRVVSARRERGRDAPVAPGPGAHPRRE